jgi:dihydroorotate dehydrogenase (NAD+) catalytic subunit
VAAGGARFWADPARLESTLARLRPLTELPLIAKLSPDVTDIRETARACERGGADALTAVNTFVGMAIDLERMRSRLGKATGGLSGPAVKPLALARCWEAAHAVRIPVIGSGGITSGRDALEFLAAGATAVQVGTATFVEPGASTRVVTEMREWLAAHGMRRAADLVGRLDAPHAQTCAPTPGEGKS